jgi:hypothetical protein
MKKVISLQNLSKITGLSKSTLREDINNGVLKIKRYRANSSYEIESEDLFSYCGLMHYSYCGKERADLPENVKAKFEMLPDKNSGVEI